MAGKRRLESAADACKRAKTMGRIPEPSLDRSGAGVFGLREKRVRAFLQPVVTAWTRGQSFDMKWKAGGLNGIWLVQAELLLSALTPCESPVTGNRPFLAKVSWLSSLWQNALDSKSCYENGAAAHQVNPDRMSRAFPDHLGFGRFGLIRQSVSHGFR